MRSVGRARRVGGWSVVAVLGEVLFTLGWLMSDWLADPAYRPLRDDLSDLGARTATHPWLYLLPELIAGLTSVGFALFALRPLLVGAGRLGSVAAWFSAAASLQDLTDPVFRLPCRAADGCSVAQQTVGWSGQLHATLGLLGLVLSVVSGVLLWRAFTRLAEWRRLAWPALAVTLLVVVAVPVIGASATAPVHGLVQRLLVVVAGVFGIWVAQRAYVVRNR